jgi:hypothetical protein
MVQILEILKYVIPALIVLASCWLILRSLLRTEKIKQDSLLAVETHKYMLPLRLQAYERFTLLLERITPESLLMRHSDVSTSARALHTALLAAIRAEYEHNMSQQIYVDAKVWDAVVLARTQITQIINLSADGLDASATSFDLSRKIFEHCATHSKLPTQTALEVIRNVVGDEFRG